MQLTETQLQTILHAMRVAAERFQEDRHAMIEQSNIASGNPAKRCCLDLANQFEKQAVETRQLANLCEENGLAFVNLTCRNALTELPGEATANPPAFRQRYAYVAVYTGPGTRCGIGRADEGESGYNPRPELGSFDSYNSAASHADKLNAELGLSIEESAKVIASTMR